MIAQCTLCYRPFESSGTRHRFCSKLCERATNNEHRRSKKNDIPFDRDRAIKHAEHLREIDSHDGKQFNVPCYVCNKMVLTNVRKRTFCSDEHRKAWEREKEEAKVDRRRAEPRRAGNIKIQPPPPPPPLVDVEAIPVDLSEFRRARLQQLENDICAALAPRRVEPTDARRRPNIYRDIAMQPR